MFVSLATEKSEKCTEESNWQQTYSSVYRWKHLQNKSIPDAVLTTTWTLITYFTIYLTFTVDEASSRHKYEDHRLRGSASPVLMATG